MYFQGTDNLCPLISQIECSISRLYKSLGNGNKKKAFHGGHCWDPVSWVMLSIHLEEIWSFQVT